MPKAIQNKQHQNPLSERQVDFCIFADSHEIRRDIMREKIYILGHKNPDTDSVCAAISMAYLKNATDKDATYIPLVAGEVNSETEYVLNRFGVNVPEVTHDIRRQAGDLNVTPAEMIDKEATIKEVAETMVRISDYTLPVGEDGELIGIVTGGDVARFYMNVDDRVSIAAAKTKIANIIRVVEGSLVCGDEDRAIAKGTVRVVAAGTDLTAKTVEPGDVVVISKNDENNEMIAKKGDCVIILCGGGNPTDDLKKLAEKNNTTIISSNYDIYEVVRVLKKCIPARHIMRAIDEVQTFSAADFLDDIKKIIIEKRHREYPIIENGTFKGMLSKGSLLDSKSKKIIMVDHNEIDQAVFGVFDATVSEVVDHHKLSTVETMQPISVTNMPWGSTCTIIANMYEEQKQDVPNDIAGLLCSAILSDTMYFKSPTCTDIDKEIAKRLAKKANIDLDILWDEMLSAGLNLDAKTEKEIFYQDYKQFTSEELTFGAGQVLAANQSDVDKLKERMLPYLNDVIKEEKIDMVCLMITDVSADSTELIFAGSNAKNIVESAFGVKEKDGGVYLEGVMSRKKQLVPPIMAVLQK